MCLGVPMRVIKIEESGKQALAEAQGVKREISTIFLDKELKVGDWVTVHVGYALDVIDTATAKEIFFVMGITPDPSFSDTNAKGVA
jgi:hydrogenase expression/formation protein HypC